MKLTWIFFAICIITLISSCSNKKDYISLVKNAELTEYQGKKIGNVFESQSKDCKWEHLTRANGENYVKLTVIENNNKVVFLFQINKDESVSFYSITLNGMKLDDSVALFVIDSIFNKKVTSTPENSQTAISNTAVEAPSTNTNEMIFVQGGTFQMGSDDGAADEKPVHEVTVSDFYISKYEVTEQEIIDIWNDHNKKLFQQIQELEKTDFDKAKSFTNAYVKYDSNGELQLYELSKSESPELPSLINSWDNAVEFCNWKSEKEGLAVAYTFNGKDVNCDFTSKGYRLPTEAEWEYAARGGNKSQGYKYAGGSNYLKVAWMCENSGLSVNKVGTKDPNELGLYDMSGNLKEYCWDPYGPYAGNSATDPHGPSSSYQQESGSGRWIKDSDIYAINRVSRGGGWKDDARSCLVTNRIGDGTYFGFRFVRSAVNSTSTGAIPPYEHNDTSESDKINTDINSHEVSPSFVKESDLENAKGQKAYTNNQYSEAISCFTKATELNPNNSKAYSNLALVYRKQKKYEQAIANNKKAITIAQEQNDPGTKANSYYNMAKCYEEQKMWNEARDCFVKASELRTNNADLEGIKRMDEKLK